MSSSIPGALDQIRPVSARRTEEATPAPAPAHSVQFYETETYLIASVADFLAAGLAAEQPCIAILTSAHGRDLLERFAELGIDVLGARRDGRLALLDAREVVDDIMTGVAPDAARFAARIGDAVARCRRAGRNGAVRMYGEMVDLLWKDGNPDGAVRLERLWNRYLSMQPASLLCAYAMDNFKSDAHAARFDRICYEHSHVVPTERFTRLDDRSRNIEIGRLQQRARALEAEVERRQELERRLVAALADLESAAAERERLLAAERAARAEAEAANRAKSEFLAVMSHELRTPLNAIAGYVQLVEMGVHGPVTDGQREALLRVQRSQTHLLSLINDVLNLARIETGRVRYDLESVRLAPVLKDTLGLVEPLLAAASLSCRLTVAPASGAEPGPVVRADRDKLQQILLNLLGNAVKFTPAGGRIAVDAAVCAEDPSFARVRVRDTGVGIAAGKLDSVFEPFVQLGPWSGGQRDGVGLGLAVSRDLALRMGGDITVSSKVGKGSTFTLKLPRA